MWLVVDDFVTFIQCTRAWKTLCLIEWSFGETINEEWVMKWLTFYGYGCECVGDNFVNLWLLRRLSYLKKQVYCSYYIYDHYLHITSMCFLHFLRMDRLGLPFFFFANLRALMKESQPYWVASSIASPGYFQKDHQYFCYLWGLFSFAVDGFYVLVLSVLFICSASFYLLQQSTVID